MTISQKIKEFEGAGLVKLRGNKVYQTPFGRKVYQRLKQK
jgi:hypothetical protein